MANGTYKYQSDFAKRYVAQGEARGEVRGEARALLRVLEARGLLLGTDVRQRIETCTDLALLDTWLARAARAASIDDVF